MLAERCMELSTRPAYKWSTAPPSARADKVPAGHLRLRIVLPRQKQQKMGRTWIWWRAGGARELTIDLDSDSEEGEEMTSARRKESL